MLEDRPTRLRRLAWRSTHRGTREMDLILGAFAPRLALLPDATLDLYERLLEEPDPDLLLWLTGQAAPPAPFAAILATLRASLDAPRRPDPPEAC